MLTPKPRNASEQKLIEKLTQVVNQGLEVIAGLDEVEVVVGVPFQNEDDTLLPGVVQNAQRGLEQEGLSGKAIVMCVGPQGSEVALNAALVQDELNRKISVYGFLLDKDFKDPGWGIRALMETASRFTCPLILFPPNLISLLDDPGDPDTGRLPSWIHRLLIPVRDYKQDLALASFSRHPLSNSVESLLTVPVVDGVFGFRLKQPMPRIMAMSNKLVQSCLGEIESWPKKTGVYGFDPWLVVHTLAEKLPICEVPLGAVSFRKEVGKLKLIFRGVAHILLEQVVTHSSVWINRQELISAPGTYGHDLDLAPKNGNLDLADLIGRFKLEFNHFNDTLFKEIVTDALRDRLERLADQGIEGRGLTAEEWIRALNDFLLAYRFENKFHPEDIVDGLFAVFLARLVGFIQEVDSIEKSLKKGTSLSPSKYEEIVRREAEVLVDRQAGLFGAGWTDFQEAWQKRETETGPYLTRVGAWEFVPHVGVIVPQELKRPDGGSVWANQIYQELIDQYREEFASFLAKHLGLKEATDSAGILGRVHRFMRRLDRALGVDVFRVDLNSAEVANEMITRIWRSFAPEQTFQLTKEAAQTVLRQVPPTNLIMQSGCDNVSGLLDKMDPNDAMGLASWTDRRHYFDQVLDIIDRDGQIDWFHMAPLKPVVVDLSYLKGAAEVRGSTALARLAGRVMVGNHGKGWGGEFKKLWFFLKAIKSIVSAELFSETWIGFANSKIDFVKRLIASIKGHWGRRVLSAHNAFENRHQRVLVTRLKQFAKNLVEQDLAMADTARIIDAAASVYHLSITLPDATFVPLSAWTWASYSRRGGVGAPTPLSSLVERDWATRDFLTTLLKRSGLGNEETIDKKICDLMGRGRESEGLSQHLLGVSADPDHLVVRQSIPPDSIAVPTGRLDRPVDRPILEPVSDNKWESRYVFNAAAARLEGTVYILYRALGEDEISRIGLAWTRDGIHIDGRLEYPIFEPVHPSESAGCEDPRVSIIDDRLYMLYTAWDGKVPQIAMASIPVQALIENRFDDWERHGLGFPGLHNKDAVLYPEKFNGQYVIYHRIDPNMWISYLDDLACPWPRTGQKIVVGPRPGMMWDGVKIGAGAQPIKTTKGWLNLYHGVDYERSYRLGVLFMALDDPSKVIYQSPGPILEPEMDFEIGRSGGKNYWTPHVVFTCGAVPAKDKEVLDLEDEVLVYYGAADTVISVAKARLIDLVPTLK